MKNEERSMKIRNTHKLKQRVEEIMTIRSWIRQFAAGSILVAILVTLPFSPALGQGAGVEIDEPLIPPGTDVFDLNLEQTREFSRSLNFKVVGHSYLKGPHLTPAAQAEGTGAGLNGVYVHDGIACG
jgi:hypothetical protein